MRIIPAQPDDVAKLLAVREEAVAWLAYLGTDQWQRPYPADFLLATIKADTAFMVMDGEATAATLTLTTEAEPGLWTEHELSEPSRFVNMLTVARTHAGQDLGGGCSIGQGIGRTATGRNGCGSMRGLRTNRSSGTTSGRGSITCVRSEGASQ